MPPLQPFPLPLQNNPPPGFECQERDTSDRSSATAFNTGIDVRDFYLGSARCIVCGLRSVLDHCHIIPQSETNDTTPTEIWETLKRQRYLPQQLKEKGSGDPRNGISMCPNHHRAFDSYKFFIRYIPETHKYVFVNYGELSDFQSYHGKLVALDGEHNFAPFPTVFVIHEIRVRAYYPFRTTTVNLPDQPPWQDWIINEGIVDTSGALQHAQPSTQDPAPPDSGPSQLQFQQANTGSDPAGGSGQYALQLNDQVIADILTATWAMPSWKACQREGTSWVGTAEENIQKYKETIGVENH